MSLDSQILGAIRAWMQQVMNERGWSACEWARMADTSATNITRVLDPAHTIMPRVDTIGRLARVAGSQPNLAGIRMVQPAAKAQQPRKKISYAGQEQRRRPILGPSISAEYRPW